MTATATHSINLPPHFAADIEQEVVGELFKMGYGRISITERDLPGLHFPKTMQVGPSYIKIFANTRVTVGANLVVVPIPYRNEAGNWTVNSRRNILLQAVRINEADRKTGQLTVQDPWTKESYTLDVVFDPEGPDLRAHLADHLRQAVVNTQAARSRSPLHRLAGIFGL